MGNASFKPSEFDKQAAASLDMMDVEVAQERVQAILGKQAGPTLTPQPQTQPSKIPAPKTDLVGKPITAAEANDPNFGKPAPRKKRSDAGVPKKAPADPDEIVLKLKPEQIMDAALILSQTSQSHTAMLMLMQMNVHLQKRLDMLSRSK